MKTWWETLQQRERLLISISAVIGLTMLFINFISLPLWHAKQNARNRLQSTIQRLQLIQHLSQRVSLARANGIPLKFTPKSSLLATIETSYAQCHLTQSIQSLQKTNQNTLTLSFHNVDFDTFIRCTQQLTRTHGISILTLTAKRTFIAGQSVVVIVFV